MLEESDVLTQGYPEGIPNRIELADAVRKLALACRLPVIVDVDTGFGETLNVARTIRELEDAGAAAVHIEDQQLPKKCGHLEGKLLVSAEEMARKVAAAVATRRGTLVIARTDARAIEGLQGAIRRARLYKAAGADIIFPEALQSEDEFAREIPGPLLANMTEFGKSPLVSATRLGELGYQIVIYPVSALRIALRAVEAFLAGLRDHGGQAEMVEQMLTRAELYDLINYQEYVDFDSRLQRPDGPQAGQG